MQKKKIDAKFIKISCRLLHTIFKQDTIMHFKSVKAKYDRLFVYKIQLAFLLPAPNYRFNSLMIYDVASPTVCYTIYSKSYKHERPILIYRFRTHYFSLVSFECNFSEKSSNNTLQLSTEYSIWNRWGERCDAIWIIYDLTATCHRFIICIAGV